MLISSILELEKKLLMLLHSAFEGKTKIYSILSPMHALLNLAFLVDKILDFKICVFRHFFLRFCFEICNIFNLRISRE